MKFQIKPGLEIGDLDEHIPVFIVAEIGSNWKTLGDCLHSINMAKACGADAVKFQLFDEQALYGSDNTLKLEGKLPLEWLPKLKTHADALEIEFMCSAFSPELIDAVNPFVRVHKVASAELTHLRMLERFKALGKPVILSTGASGTQDIRMAIEVLQGVPVILLYCIAAYPARSVRLEHIDTLRKEFGVPVGFSDHSHDIFTIPSEAIFQHQACVIEKHLNAIEGLTSPDSEHSLSVDEFKLMVTRCRNNVVHEARQSHEETEMYLFHNRRLIATREVLAGEEFIEGVNFGIYRSLIKDTQAMHPFMIGLVNGKRAKRKIEPGKGIGVEDV